MKRSSKSWWPIIFLILSFTFALHLPVTAFAGDPDSPGAPSSGSNMPNLTDIYNQLDTGATSTPAGAFQEPSSGPTAGTGKSLSDIKLKLPEPDNTNGATAADVLSGKTFWGLRTDGTWGLKTGTISSQGDVSGSAGSLTFPIPEGYYSGRTATANDSNLVSGNIRSGMSIFGVSGKTEVVDTTEGASPAAAGDMLSGKKAFVNGNLVTGNVAAGSNVSGANGSKTFTIPDGIYSGSKTATAGDTNLVAGNIKPGVTIFGVTGAHTCNGTIYNQAGGGARWCDQGNGTVMDMTTGLIWMKDSSCLGTKTWATAVSSCVDSVRSGSCGLTDGSEWGDWRLPTLAELFGITNNSEPVRSGSMQAFANVYASDHWSSTTYTESPVFAWVVHFVNGSVYAYGSKGITYMVRCVRAGQ